MTKKERIINAIQHKPPTDLCPWNIEVTLAFAKNLCAATGAPDADTALDNNKLSVKYKQNTTALNADSVDLFGAHWKASPDGGDVGVVSLYPLADSEGDFGSYTFPRPNPTLAAKVCNTLDKAPDQFTMFSITMGYFERSWSLRGMEGILIDMLLEENFTFQLYEHILNHHMELLELVLGRSFDALYFGDDWGQQQGLIMGPDLWRKYIKPGVSKLFRRAKDAGKYVVLHSCGDLRPILPDLVEMGVDVYNTLQPEIYNFAELKREYGKHLTFYGGISTQQFLPQATPQQVREKTLEILKTMAADGGYILSPTHAVTPDIPPENILAMLQANREFYGVSEGSRR